jgi:hypothetical protein
MSKWSLTSLLIIFSGLAVLLLARPLTGTGSLNPILLPDASTCSSGGPCLSITQTGTGAGIRGLHADTTGAGILAAGVRGETNSTQLGAAGVWGEARAKSGQTVGVEGHSLNSPIGTGVVGFGRATGGYYEALGNSGTRVGAYGVGFEMGVSGRSKLPFTTEFGDGGIGVYGENNLARGIGVKGRADNGTGVIGVSNSGIAVYGISAGRALAGLFQGNVNITGSLTKGSGGFKIDHPLAPANKYLSHSFVESPDMMNVYNGNIMTNSNGDATVVLPAYFEALNRDFRYQLTIIGQFAQAIVASEVKNNCFSIKTDKPNVKVSWQVTGIRQDAYAKAYPIRVEEEKSGTAMGHYLHPELYAQAQAKDTGN